LRNALYLIRPDSYVGLANQSGSVDILQRYFGNAESGSSRLVVRNRTRLNEAKSRLREPSIP